MPNLRHGAGTDVSRCASANFVPTLRPRALCGLESGRRCVHTDRLLRRREDAEHEAGRCGRGVDLAPRWPASTRGPSLAGRQVLVRLLTRDGRGLRGLRRRMPRDLLRVLERPAVRQVRRDPRRPERVAAASSAGSPAAAARRLIHLTRRVAARAPGPSAVAPPGPRSGRGPPSAPRACPPRRRRRGPRPPGWWTGTSCRLGQWSI